jgi:hypothetical protein
MADPKKRLKLITAPSTGSVVDAPPVLKAVDGRSRKARLGRRAVSEVQSARSRTASATKATRSTGQNAVPPSLIAGTCAQVLAYADGTPRPQTPAVRMAK